MDSILFLLALVGAVMIVVALLVWRDRREWLARPRLILGIDLASVERFALAMAEMGKAASVSVVSLRFFGEAIGGLPGLSAIPDPDCLAGKHSNCGGEGWGEEADAPAPCPCGCHEEAGS